MIFSLNEYQSLVKAASRGAGLYWGEAVECAGAAQWLGAHGIAAVSACATALGMISRGEAGRPETMARELRAGSGALCPFRAGMMLSDYGYRLEAMAPLTLHDLAEPVLILPFLAQAALHAGSLRLEGAGFGVTVSPEGWAGTLPQSSEPRVMLACTEAPATVHGRTTTRVEIGSTDYRILSDLATLTYAPATSESRLRGAGAGLLDND